MDDLRGGRFGLALGMEWRRLGLGEGPENAQECREEGGDADGFMQRVKGFEGFSLRAGLAGRSSA